MQKASLQTRLRRHLGKRYTDGLWRYLDQRGFVGEVTAGASTFENLLGEANLILDCSKSDDLAAASPVSVVDGPTAAQERALTLSKLVADLAGSDPDVVRFRQRHLHGTLMPWTEVGGWLKSRSEEDGPLTKDVTFAVPVGIDPSDVNEMAKHSPCSRARGVSVRTLAYALPGDEYTREMAVTAGGTLDILRELSEGVAKGYGWIPAQATIFVLTGTPVFIPAVRTTVTKDRVRHGRDLAWACRIILDVDPACTPEELSAAFQRVRRQQKLDRLRPLSMKHMRLAAFTGAEHESRSWADRFELWNRQFPQWRYSAASNFRRDAIRAQYQVLYPGRHRGGSPIRG